MRKSKNAGIWERETYEWYHEPRWCSERLFDEERPNLTDAVCDPFCGEGRVLDAAAARGHDTLGVDLCIRGCAHTFFQDDGARMLSVYGAGRIVASNPPLAEAFEIARRLKDLVNQGVVRKGFLLLPARFLWSDRRAEWLERSLTRAWLLTPQPSMPPGDTPEAERKGGAADYFWAVFTKDKSGPPTTRWLRRDKRS